MNQTKDEGNEDVGLPPKLERMVAHEDQEKRPHQEETKLVDLGIGSGKREVNIGTGITAPIREELIIPHLLFVRDENHSFALNLIT